jgi:hypothetical protein
MKVRSKKDNRVCYTVNNTAYDCYGEQYYAFNGCCGFHLANLFEPVPTETWRDVTGECIVQDGWEGGPKEVLTCDLDPVARIEPGYRLRKVPTHDLYMTDHKMAFIIEKREP